MSVNSKIPTVWIADHELFKEVFTRAIDRFPTDGLAAAALGCDRTRVVHMRRESPKRWVRATVVDGLRTVLENDPRALERLDAALLTDRMRALADLEAEMVAVFERVREKGATPERMKALIAAANAWEHARQRDKTKVSE